MAEVVTLFHPERWFTAWQDAGGFVTVGNVPAAAGLSPALLIMGPTFPLAEPWDSPRRLRVELLKGQVERAEARGAVLDYMLRREATAGVAE